MIKIRKIQKNVLFFFINFFISFLPEHLPGQWYKGCEAERAKRFGRASPCPCHNVPHLAPARRSPRTTRSCPCPFSKPGIKKFQKKYIFLFLIIYNYKFVTWVWMFPTIKYCSLNLLIMKHRIYSVRTFDWNWRNKVSLN